MRLEFSQSRPTSSAVVAMRSVWGNKPPLLRCQRQGLLSVITKYFTYRPDIFISGRRPKHRGRMARNAARHMLPYTYTIGELRARMKKRPPSSLVRLRRAIRRSISLAVLAKDSFYPTFYCARVRVLRASHTNPLTGTNFGAYDSERLHTVARACSISRRASAG